MLHITFSVYFTYTPPWLYLAIHLCYISGANIKPCHWKCIYWYLFSLFNSSLNCRYLFDFKTLSKELEYPCQYYLALIVVCWYCSSGSQIFYFHCLLSDCLAVWKSCLITEYLLNSVLSMFRRECQVRRISMNSRPFLYLVLNLPLPKD